MTVSSKPPFAGERVPFSKAFAEVSKGVSRIKQRDYLPAGDYPVVDQGQELFAGYSNRDDGLFSDVPVIVFGDHTRHVKYVDRPFFVGADGVKILKPRLSNYVRYWYHALRNTHLENLGYSRHFKLLKQATFCVPDEEAQRMVCDELDGIFELIKLARRQLSLLDELVKSRFVEMFGDPVENPMGFRRETLAALGGLKNGVNYHKGETGCTVLCLGVSDFGNRSELRGVSGLSPVSFSSRPSEESFLKDGDIVFVRSNGNRKLVGRCMAVYPQGDDVIYSGFCIRFRLTSDNVRIPYLVWSLKQPSMRELLLGRGANVQNLSQRALSDVLVPIPSLRMQDAFAAFAAEVAKSRVAVRQQIEKLRTLYDSLAQDYFG